jgi:hypothetical protein
LALSQCFGALDHVIDIYAAERLLSRASRERVAAVRSTNSFENAIPHERLQDRFEMARWQAMAGG